ncbi:MAG: ORF6N domain-containing protein [Pyrinomonadaceae bacterium]
MVSNDAQSKFSIAVARSEPLICEVRGERVILDSDLARIYGVPTKALNQAVKRNKDRFPEDFMFKLTRRELLRVESQITISVIRSNEFNRSQFVTGSQKHRDPRVLPYAFTEHGAIMAANVLNNQQAVQMSVFIVRAFVKLREILSTHKELAHKIAELERKLGTYDEAIVSIFAAIRQLMTSPAPKRHAIGFASKAKSGAAEHEMKKSKKTARRLSKSGTPRD